MYHDSTENLPLSFCIGLQIEIPIESDTFIYQHYANWMHVIEICRILQSFGFAFIE